MIVKKPTNITVGGDICPAGKIESYFITSKLNEITGEIAEIFKKSDYVIANLECPLIKHKSPIEKDGPILGADYNCAKGLKAIGIDAVNLANNHILDHGDNGIKSTISSCINNDIEFFGASDNLRNASKPLIKVVNNKRFCFMGIAEHEFSIAQHNSYGACSADFINTYKTIFKYKQEYDFLIILFHGGKEYYQYPSPKLQEYCRFLIEIGADCVICQHSHCSGSYENYLNRPIFYGQGNFIFENSKPRSNQWYYGFLINLFFENDDKVEFDLIPFKQSYGFKGVKLLFGDEKVSFLKDFHERSKKVLSKQFVYDSWLELCKKEKYLYYSRVLGHNKIFRLLNKYINFSDWIYSKQTKLMVRNVIECETHREGLETVLKKIK